MKSIAQVAFYNDQLYFVTTDKLVRKFEVGFEKFEVEVPDVNGILYNYLYFIELNHKAKQTITLKEKSGEVLVKDNVI